MQNRVKRTLLLIFILLIGALSMTFIITPPVTNHELMDRAHESLQFVASDSRFVGSEHLRATEQFIVDRLTEAGLPAQVFEHRHYYSDIDFNDPDIRITFWGPDSIVPNPLVIRDIYSYIPGTSGQVCNLFCTL
jgi:hypothetical protein